MKLLNSKKLIFAFIHSVKDALAANKIYFILGAIFVLSTGICQISIPYIIGKLIDVLSRNNGSSEVIFWAVSFFSIFGLNTVFTLLKKYCFAKFAEKTTISITSMIFSKVIRLPLYYFDKNNIGDLTSRINNDIQALKKLFSEQIAQLLYQPLIMIGCLCNLFLISAKLTIILLMVFPLILFLSLRFGNKIKALSKRTFDLYANANNILVEDLKLIRVIKSFSSEYVEEKRYNAILSEVEEKSVEVTVSVTKLQSVISLMLLFGLCVVIGYAIFLIENALLTSGQLLEYIICTIFIINAFSNTANTFGIIMNSVGVYSNIHQILAQDIENLGQTNSCKIQFEELSFKHVFFSYPKRNIQILQDISFSIKRGEKIGIIGVSGGGKSTLVKLMLRFYNPICGNIYINQIPIEHFPLMSYRKIFGYVSQEVELFAGSIKENIMYPEILSENEVVEAAKKSCAHDFIMKLPDKYETKIGENGVILSGGQRQRISIARALSKHPQILILDEATSALDKETEGYINEFVSSNIEDVTMIVLSHKMQIINRMDRVFDIKNNNLIEQKL